MPVTLSVNGVDYRGWETIQITRSMETLSGGFELSVSERWPGQNAARAINPGDKCVVKIDADVVVTGYVDEARPSFDAESHGIRIRGRDRAGDLVDCSAIHKPGQWSGRKMESIVAELVAPFGIKVKTETDTGEAFAKFNLQQGETVHDAIERMAKMRAVLVLSDGKGDIVITRAGTNRAATALIEGQNIKGGEGTNSWADRFSQYLCKGQDQGGDNTSATVFTAPKGAATDKEITRYRPLLVMAEGKANIKQCQDRAAWERSVRRGKGQSATINVAGWRQGDGRLWEFNSISRVNSPTLKINEAMLISEVTFSLDDQGGSLAELKVVRPDAYKLIPEPERT